MFYILFTDFHRLCSDGVPTPGLFSASVWVFLFVSTKSPDGQPYRFLSCRLLLSDSIIVLKKASAMVQLFDLRWEIVGPTNETLLTWEECLQQKLYATDLIYLMSSRREHIALFLGFIIDKYGHDSRAKRCFICSPFGILRLTVYDRFSLPRWFGIWPDWLVLKMKQ